MSQQDQTEFEKSLRRLKDHRVVARIAVLGLILSSLVGLAGNAMELWDRISSDSQARQLADPDDQPSGSIADEAFSPVSFEEYVDNAMVHARTDRTELQRQAYVDSMEAKRVLWTAPVLAVQKLSSESLSITLERGGMFASFKFDVKDTAELMALKRDDVVQLTGVIGRSSGTSVELIRCRIVRALGQGTT